MALQQKVDRNEGFRRWLEMLEGGAGVRPGPPPREEAAPRLSPLAQALQKSSILAKPSSGPGEQRGRELPVQAAHGQG